MGADDDLPAGSPRRRDGRLDVGSARIRVQRRRELHRAQLAHQPHPRARPLFNRRPWSVSELGDRIRDERAQPRCVERGPLAGASIGKIVDGVVAAAEHAEDHCDTHDLHHASIAPRSCQAIRPSMGATRSRGDSHAKPAASNRADTEEGRSGCRRGDRRRLRRPGRRWRTRPSPRRGGTGTG